MELYLGNQLKDWTTKFAPFFQKVMYQLTKKVDEGYESPFEYWKLVQIKEEKNLTFIEKQMLKEFKEHLQIQEVIFLSYLGY